MQYTSETMDRGLFYELGVPIQLKGYMDANWVSRFMNLQSSSIFCIIIGEWCHILGKAINRGAIIYKPHDATYDIRIDNQI